MTDDALDTFVTSMAHELPEVVVTLEVTANRFAWIELVGGFRPLTVEHRPNRGFGLYVRSGDDWSGPDEIYTDVPSLISRLRDFF